MSRRRTKRSEVTGFGVLRALAYTAEQWEQLQQEKRDGRRCPHCGVPATAQTKDERGVCRFCGDGQEIPF